MMRYRIDHTAANEAGHTLPMVFYWQAESAEDAVNALLTTAPEYGLSDIRIERVLLVREDMK
ncbi:hypothetical protein [Morganella morganii]|uniref:hypothetical protein n=1 Tax=Morganella morganii TaxID=582 RepID=UPI00052E384D|nr:hypothetical protein [Morganella morganii]KGP46392.1 hypothetical protein LR61_02490 [Morganella morganii]